MSSVSITRDEGTAMVSSILEPASPPHLDLVGRGNLVLIRLSLKNVLVTFCHDGYKEGTDRTVSTQSVSSMFKSSVVRRSPALTSPW